MGRSAVTDHRRREQPSPSSLPKSIRLTDDVRDRRRAERRNLADALAHERNVLRTMIDLIPAFIYAKDAHSRFTACNKLVANRMGVEPEELIGKTDFDFYPREMAEKFFADEQALIQSGKPLIDCEEIASTRRAARTASSSPPRFRCATPTAISPASSARASTSPIARPPKSAWPRATGSSPSAGSPPAWRTKSTRRSSTSTTACRSFAKACRNCSPTSTRCTRRCRSRREPDDDVEYLREELPPALTRVADGLSRIAEIVRSMKDFSHADQNEMSEVDLNRAIASTLVIARSEYKDVRGPRNRATARFPASPATADRSTRWCSISW